MFSRITGLLSLLTVLLGILNTAEVLAIIPPTYAPWITAAAAIVLGLSRALVDSDGDGTPDVLAQFQRRREADRP